MTTDDAGPYRHAAAGRQDERDGGVRVPGGRLWAERSGPDGDREADERRDRRGERGSGVGFEEPGEQHYQAGIGRTGPQEDRSTPLVLARLRGLLNGDLLLAGDAGYDNARRLWNGQSDRRPAAIVQCADQNDVVHALRAAQAAGLEVSVRGDGHGFSGATVRDGGLMIDLRRIDMVDVDLGRPTVRRGGDVLSADPDTQVRSTSNWAAALRAVEHDAADSFIDDPLAAKLCTDTDLHEIASQPGAPHGSVAVRTRLGDELVLAAAAAGVRQIVSLGAGSDTRPFRLPFPDHAGLHYYEVDLPGQIASRDRLLGGMPARVPRTTIAADLRDTTWPDLLKATSWEEEASTVWVLEGLLYYLATHETDALVTTISRLSAPGSALTLDVPHIDFQFAEHSRAYRQFLAHHRSPYLTGIGDPSGWLRELGWRPSAYLPDTLGDCEILPPVPKRLLGYRDVWHVIATRGPTLTS